MSVMSEKPCGVAKGSAVDSWTALEITGSFCGRESTVAVQENSSKTDCCQPHADAWMANKPRAHVAENYFKPVSDEELAEVMALLTGRAP